MFKKKLIFVFCIFCILMFFLSKRMNVYEYDATLSNNYNFKGKKVDSLSVNIDNNILRASNFINTDVTVLLKVKIESSFLGKIFEPSIEFSCDSIKEIQYFELNSSGFRFVDISKLVKECGVIEIKTSHLDIVDSELVIYSFENIDIKKSRILVIAPHPDDAEISSLGLYSSVCSDSVNIVTVCSGNGGRNLYNNIAESREEQFSMKKTIRIWNSLAIPMIVGISPLRCENMEFADGSLKKLYFNKSRESKEKCWTSLIRDLSNLIVKYKPDIIIAPHPQIDSHSDHKYSTLAVIEALKAIRYNKGSLLLYTNHPEVGAYFPYGKMHSLISLYPNYNNDLYFDKIYSMSLDHNTQIKKLLSLEAMNDLRHKEFMTSYESFYNSCRKIKKELFNEDFSYYRKSVRCNEIYYEIKFSSLYDELVFNEILKLTDI